jgi:hypothetical protein
MDGGAKDRSPAQRSDIVLNAAGARESVVLQTAHGPDWATLVFCERCQRLMQDQIVGDLLLVLLSGEARTQLQERLGNAGLASTHECTHPHISLSLSSTGPLGDSAPVRTECCHEPPHLAQLPDIWFGQGRVGGERGQALLGHLQATSDPGEGRFGRPSYRLWCAHQAPEGYRGSALFSAAR